MIAHLGTGTFLATWCCSAQRRREGVDSTLEPTCGELPSVIGGHGQAALGERCLQRSSQRAH
jgi:hypothetical protein